jgi:hypothetical protein
LRTVLDVRVHARLAEASRIAFSMANGAAALMLESADASSVDGVLDCLS